MKTFTLPAGRGILLCLLLTHVLLTVLSASPQKIPIATAVAQGKASLTATTWDLGDVNNCFDGDIYTMMRSANINPAFVQIAFAKVQSVKQIRVLLGEPDYPAINSNSWWVEVADSQSDMDSKSGTYQLIVPRRDDVNGIWDTVYDQPRGTYLIAVETGGQRMVSKLSCLIKDSVFRFTFS